MTNKQSMSKKFNININIDKDDADLNDFLFITHEFGSRPSKIIFYTQFDSKSIWNTCYEKFGIGDESINKVSEVIPDGLNYLINNKYCLKLDKDIYLTFLEFSSPDSEEGDERIIANFTIFYNNINVSNDRLNEIIHLFDDSVIHFDELESKERSSFIKLGLNGYELIPFNNGIDLDNIELYYNDITFTKINKLIKNINKSKSGLSVLWGERGTGKTHISSYISSEINKALIFIPNNMVESTINNPEFISFLERHNNSVILIDDCGIYENIYKSNMLINNIKQIVDGILSNHLNINVILISNSYDVEDVEDILDCNSIIGEVEFNELEPKKATELSRHIGKNRKYKTPIILTNVLKDKKGATVSNEIGY